MGEVVNLDDYRDRPLNVFYLWEGDDKLTVIFDPAASLQDKAAVLDVICDHLLDEDPPTLIS